MGSSIRCLYFSELFSLEEWCWLTVAEHFPSLQELHIASGQLESTALLFIAYLLRGRLQHLHVRNWVSRAQSQGALWEGLSFLSSIRSLSSEHPAGRALTPLTNFRHLERWALLSYLVFSVLLSSFSFVLPLAFLSARVLLWLLAHR
jgi:hypothetical protein